uniref:Plectrovirus SVGII3 orf 10 transmembrane protein n=1 Tax=Spiroplasma citri TaxID=2133 RepID=Q14KV5_SPICI|nr:plectrovirus SVGII3 orf 10 transmembrane protein [Spiroplasma citri]
MDWNIFLQRVYQGLLQIFYFIPKTEIDNFVGSSIDNITYSVIMIGNITYSVIMIGVWLVVFFLIWLSIFILYKTIRLVV